MSSLMGLYKQHSFSVVHEESEETKQDKVIDRLMRAIRVKEVADGVWKQNENCRKLMA
jgi:phage tail tube protein FII